MSITPDDRLAHGHAMEILRDCLRVEAERRRAWQVYAESLEQQMRREGWTQEDFDDLLTVKPE